MDDEIERLERLHAQDPNDHALGARLKAALLRAGRRDEVARRYEAAFRCSQDFDAMTHRSPGVSTCASCKRDVHFALSYVDFKRLAAKGHCLALRPDRLPAVIQGLVDDPERGLARAPTDPCLVRAKSKAVEAAAQAAQWAPMRLVYGSPPPRRSEPPQR